MRVAADDDVDVGSAVVGDDLVDVEAAVREDDDDVDTLGAEEGGLGANGGRFVEELQLAGVGDGL